MGYDHSKRSFLVDGFTQILYYIVLMCFFFFIYFYMPSLLDVCSQQFMDTLADQADVIQPLSLVNNSFTTPSYRVYALHKTFSINKYIYVLSFTVIAQTVQVGVQRFHIHKHQIFKKKYIERSRQNSKYIFVLYSLNHYLNFVWELVNCGIT